MYNIFNVELAIKLPLAFGQLPAMSEHQIGEMSELQRRLDKLTVRMRRHSISLVASRTVSDKVMQLNYFTGAYLDELDVLPVVGIYNVWNI